MTTEPLPPLAEVFRGVYSNARCEGLTFVQEHGLDRYDARIRELEAENAKLKDELAVLNQDFAERMAKFRALAKRAAEFAARCVRRWEDRDAILAELAEMHKETP